MLGDIDIPSLFLKKAEEISDEEFKALVLHYRAERGKFLAAEAEGKPAPRKKKLESVSLKDLGL